jgi:hypothetical protein
MGPMANGTETKVQLLVRRSLGRLGKEYGIAARISGLVSAVGSLKCFWYF